MKLLLDQGIGRSVRMLLAQNGYDVIHVGDVGLASAGDEAILRFASEESRCIITHDADFHAILARADATGPSVIRIRIEGLIASELAHLITSVLPAIESELEQGAIVSIGPAWIRTKLLPVRGESE